MDNTALVYPLEIGVPSPTVFVFSCFAASFLSTVGIVWLLRGNPWRVARPALMVAIWLAVIFQWPTALIASEIETSLPNAWLFALAVNFPPIALIGWTSATPRFDLPRDTVSKPEFSAWQAIVPLTLSALFVAIYLARVPIDCTAAYAMLFDPEVSLLAREFAGKIAATRLSGYSLGAMVNTTAPVALALVIWSGVIGFRRRSILIVAASATATLLLVGMVLLTGTKGLLVPSILVLAISTAIWTRGSLRKFVATIAMVGLLAVAVVGFELIRDRDNTGTRDAYEFGSCSARGGQCEKSADLVTSLLARQHSLGIAPDRLKRIIQEMELQCPGSVQIAQNKIKAGDSYGSASRPIPSASPNGILESALLYAEAIAYRAFVIPTQVGSWHFLYTADFGAPGMAAMPLARYYFESAINMPELVYQAYGSVYSGGDRTSTSTSPTSFVLAYPAYIGWVGVLIGIFAIVALDVVWSALLRLVPTQVVAISIGLLTVIAMNMMLSDFVVVMSTHGGGIAIVLVILLSLPQLRENMIQARNRRPRPSRQP